MFDLENLRLLNDSSPETPVPLRASIGARGSLPTVDSIGSDLGQKLTGRSNTSRFFNMTNRTRKNSFRSSVDGYQSIENSFEMNFNARSLNRFSQDYSDSEYEGDESYYTAQSNLSHIKLPKVVVRNPKGQILRTESSFQKALAEARVRVREEGRKLTSEEWRLPEAPVPSRPDYSRFGMNEDGTVIKQSTKKRPKLNNGIDYVDPECFVS